jgi:hypothetical protein
MRKELRESASLFVHPNASSAFLKYFASCDFSAVTTFRFHKLQYLEPTEPALIALLALLDSVETLEIGHESILNVLSSVYVTGRLPFPLLKTLKVERVNHNAASSSNSFAMTILSFIAQRRRDCDTPVEVLDLTACDFYIPQDLTYLEEMDG